ncbi:molecular chaperone GroEL, partial [Pseudomonas sp. HMWF031]
MAHSKIVFRATAREKILSGATQLADAVRVTLGPKSKSVLIQNKWGNPTVCNDGVTIAKRIDLLDPEENLGAQMLRQAAERTGEAVGDGTSTSTVLAHAILADGIRNVVAGASAIDLKRGLDLGLSLVVASLAAQSRPVSTPREKAQVATLSAHNDAVIGQLVADALEKVGIEGVVSVEESKTTETVVEVMEGMRFDRGYVSPYFVTDAEKMQVELDDAYLLLCDHKIGALKDLLPLLELIAKSGQPLVLIADDIEGEALTTMVVNQIRGVLRAVAIKAPGFGDRRKEMLQDIAILTGATVASNDLGITLEQMELSQLGRAHRVVVQKDSTALIGGAGSPEAIATRLQ